MFFAQSSHLTPDRECLSVLQIFMISFTILWSAGILIEELYFIDTLIAYRLCKFTKIVNNFLQLQNIIHSNKSFANQVVNRLRFKDYSKAFGNHLTPHWRQCWMRKHVLTLTPDICCLVKHYYYELYIRLYFTLHSISEQTFDQSFTKMGLNREEIHYYGLYNKR